MRDTRLLKLKDECAEFIAAGHRDIAVRLWTMRTESSNDIAEDEIKRIEKTLTPSIIEMYKERLTKL
jgi:hypothetical protein